MTLEQPAHFLILPASFITTKGPEGSGSTGPTALLMARIVRFTAGFSIKIFFILKSYLYPMNGAPVLQIQVTIAFGMVL